MGGVMRDVMRDVMRGFQARPDPGPLQPPPDGDLPC
jgi:hypothetical protein